MNIRRFIVLNRLPLGIAALLFAIYLTIVPKHGNYYSWLFYLVGILTIVAHFLIGPVTLLQKSIENGDIDDAKFLLSKVKKPEWLFKPVRSAYYMLNSNFSTMTEDYDQAELDIKKSIDAGIDQKDLQGSAYLQLGTISLKKGNNKEASEQLKKAIQLGLPDKDSEAGANLMLANVCFTRKDFRGAKVYYNRAVACKPKNEQIKAQILELKKYVSRIPG
jgi:tetratricopeptide (TPR) repeat protein